MAQAADVIGYQMGYTHGAPIYCTERCIPVRLVHSLIDQYPDLEGDTFGEVLPWTVDLCPGDPDLICSGCGAVIFAAPVLEDD